MWDAHQIGAVRLPDQVVEAVRLARQNQGPPRPARACRQARQLEDSRMIEVKCIGGECHGLSVKIEPQPTYYEVVDPRDRTRRDFYILEVGPQGARLVPEETAEWRGRF